jgi:hypothetical protein
MGTLAPGNNGQPGNNYNGGPGPQGSFCTIEDEPVEGAYPIYCAGNAVGILDGCEVKTFYSGSSAYEKNIVCGTNKLVMCITASSATAIDPSKKYCDDSGNDVNLPNGPDAIYNECGTSDLLFDSRRQYCGFASKKDFEDKKPAVLSFCGEEDKPNQAIDAGTCSDGTYMNKTSCISATKIWTPVWTTTSDGTTSSGEWLDQYCAVTRTGIDLEGKALYETKLDFGRRCGLNEKEKFNENAWKGEYCGFKSATNPVREKVSNACGNGSGRPDSVAFGKEYCRMPNKDAKYTVNSDVFCEVGTPNAATLTTLNKVEKFTPLTSSDWKDEYCGFASIEDIEEEKLSVQKGVCDDGKGPNGQDVKKWQNQYCQVTRAPTAEKPIALTERVGGVNNYCIADAINQFTTAGSSARINEKVWKNQYCGFASQAAATAEEPSILTGVCEDNTGPNSGSWGDEYCGVLAKGDKSTRSGERCSGAPINQGSWKGEYCGYASKADLENEIISVLAGICDVGGNPNDKSSREWVNEYCQVLHEDRVTGKTTKVGMEGVGQAGIFDFYCFADTTGADYATAGAANRINEGTWKNQYCGFANLADFTSKTFSRLTGICDDSDAPNHAKSTSWGNDYCQVSSEDQSGASTKVSGASNYCAADASTTFADLPSSARLNENAWKGQYCFADFAIGVCPGGQSPIASALSTDSPKCSFE